MYKDRKDAGKQLAEYLLDQAVEIDVVLAAPRGGMPLGRAVADMTDSPLDAVHVEKVGAPYDDEFAVGAVTADGGKWLNRRVIGNNGITREYIDREVNIAGEEAQDDADMYREIDDPVPTDGESVVVVDDGIATGATINACLNDPKCRDAESVYVAAPVGHPGTVNYIGLHADDMFVMATPDDFQAVGAYYRDFRQLDDDEALSYLIF